MTTAIEYALMAGAAYISNRDPINQFPVPQGWLATRLDNPQDGSGFEAISFINGTTIANSTEIVISFAGTDGNGSILTNPDKQADAALGMGLWSDQLGLAASYYLEVKALNPTATISFTGHSLGGGLASLLSVFFGETATTFDQAPFQAALAQAQNIKNYLLTREAGVIDTATLNNLLAPLDHYITAADPNNLNPAAADTLAVRQTQVLNFNVQGEFLSTAPWNLLSRIGTQSTDISNSASGLSGEDLHSVALLTAFLQSNQTAAPNKGLSDITFKLTDLLKMIFDPNLFAHGTGPSSDKVNLLEHLVRHEAGAAATATTAAIAADAMVTRFTSDLWKLAQSGGLTMSENTSYSNWNNVSKALIAFAMQMYYEDTANATNASKQLFTDLSAAGAGRNGVQFDMHDVSKDVAAAMDANAQVDLTKAKGYQYFQTYLDQTGLLSSEERTLIKSMLPYMRDWYVQAGASGMLATDTLNRGAFMLGSSQGDALVGGTAADLLVGNAGDDLLQGGQGNDTLLGGAGNDAYVYTTGDGLDTILDTGGQNTLAVDGTVLAGGDQYGDNRVHRSADGKHLYVDAGQGNLIIDGNIVIQNYGTGGTFGLTMNGAATDVNPATTHDIKGDPLIHTATVSTVPNDWRAISSIDNGDGTFTVDYYLIDANGNPTEPGGAARDDRLIGTSASDHIVGGGGVDHIYATQGGNDRMRWQIIAANDGETNAWRAAA